MTTSTTTAYEEALAVVRRLSLADRLRLAGALVSEAAGEVAPAAPRRPMTPDEARAAWAELRAYFATLPGPRLTLGEQLEADRRDRMLSLTGRDTEADDVDP